MAYTTDTEIEDVRKNPLVMLVEAKKRMEREKRGASILLIDMKRKGYSLDTEQAQWLKDKSGLYA